MKIAALVERFEKPVKFWAAVASILTVPWRFSSRSLTLRGPRIPHSRRRSLRGLHPKLRP